MGRFTKMNGNYVLATRNRRVYRRAHDFERSDGEPFRIR